MTLVRSYSGKVEAADAEACADYLGLLSYQNCTSLSALSISGIVNSIEAYAFAGCTSLRSVAVSGVVNYVDPTAFPSGVWR